MSNLNDDTKHLGDVLKNHAQDMTGKVLVITGTTSGTGFVCAREAAKKGAAVVLLNRQSERSEKAFKQLQTEVPNGKFDNVTCDLQSFESVRSAVESIKKNYDVVDVLVNNAGVMALPDTSTKDGYDVQMQTNVLSHFLLTKELFPQIKKSKDGRIINHSSLARLGPPLESEYFEKKGGNLGGDGTDEENFAFQGPRWVRYHQSKLANATFTYGLKNKLAAANITNVTPLLAHPGLAKTQLQVRTVSVGGMNNIEDFRNRAQTAEDGACGIIRAAMDPNVKAGDFYGPAGQGWTGFPDSLPPEELLMDEANVKINWEGCENAVGKFEM